MFLQQVCILWCVFAVSYVVTAEEATPQQVAEGEKRLSEQVQEVLRHFEQDDPVGLPGAPVPDPMDIPDMKQSFSVATMTFKKVKVYGLSKFRIEYIRSDLTAMQVSVAVRISKLDIKGDYTMSAFWSRSRGGFTVLLTDVYVEGVAMLKVQRDGKLQAEEINMDITFSDISMEFENLGFLGSIFQGIINSVGTFLFDSIKPFILKEVNQNLRGDINKNIEKIPQRFPNSIAPLDMAIADARKMVRDMGYDPYNVPNYNYTTGLFNIYLTHVWVTGLSSFYRQGNVTVTMEDNILFASAHVGSQVMVGMCHWELSFGGLISRAGVASFTVDYLHAKGTVSQPLDTRKKAKLEELELKLGNIQARMDGLGTVDYLVEFVVNVLPNILRQHIVDAIEGPLKIRVQSVLDQYNVAYVIEENIPKLEEMINS